MIISNLVKVMRKIVSCKELRLKVLDDDTRIPRVARYTLCLSITFASYYIFASRCDALN